jgi:catalase
MITKAKLFSQVGKKTECFLRFSTVVGERGATDAERDAQGAAGIQERQVRHFSKRLIPPMASGLP